MIDPPNTVVEPATILCDLDGVIWLSHQPIAGSVDAVARFRRAGHRVLFVTNNSSPNIVEHEQALLAIGIAAEGDVVGSALAAARLMQPGETALVFGNAGIDDALRQRGVDVRSSGPVDAVVVGFHRTFNYESMTRAASAVLAGARLIGTNDDANYPTPDGLIPGGGAILAAIATASATVPVVAGKPYQPMAELVRSMIGDDAASKAVMVGDRPDTDGRFARTLGCRYAHVWSGATAKGAVVDPHPDLVAETLAGIADLILAG